MKKKIIAVSGGFDPVHFCHIKMILEASEYGDVVVILNSDKWLERKKGYVFMPWSERAYCLEAIKGVVKVIEVDDSDETVCSALKELRPDYFANGGDRKIDNTPEMSLCDSLGIKMLFGVGGEKQQSSSWLINNVVGKITKRVDEKE